MTVLDKLFASTLLMIPAPAWYFLATLFCYSYSERLNGHYVDAALAGDWILYLGGVFAVLTLASGVYLLSRKKS